MPPLFFVEETYHDMRPRFSLESETNLQAILITLSRAETTPGPGICHEHFKHTHNPSALLSLSLWW